MPKWPIYLYTGFIFIEITLSSVECWDAYRKINWKWKLRKRQRHTLEIIIKLYVSTEKSMEILTRPSALWMSLEPFLSGIKLSSVTVLSQQLGQPTTWIAKQSASTRSRNVKTHPTNVNGCTRSWITFAISPLTLYYTSYSSLKMYFSLIILDMYKSSNILPFTQLLLWWNYNCTVFKCKQL